MTKRRSTPLDDKQLCAIIDAEIENSVSFDNDGEKDRREKALEYFRGEMKDVPSEVGRSSIVSTDVADTIETVLPGLLRVFEGSDKIVIYAPARPGDEESSAQATDYVNHVWANETEGYLALFTAMHDAATVRNGIIKVYWDATLVTETEDLHGLDEMQLVTLAQDAEVEIVGADIRKQIIPGPNGPVPLELYDLRVRRTTSNGRLVIEAVPPEDFGISGKAKTIDSARCVWHRSRPTRSDLIEQGYDRAKVDDLPGSDESTASTEAEMVRDDRDDQTGARTNEGDRSLDEIEIYEAYLLADMDGDGIAERWRIVKAGTRILAKEAWSDDLPFVDLVTMPVPHRWMGQSIADRTMDLARVKTVLIRGFLDNLYAQNRPQREVVEKDIVNPDEVLTPTFGGVIRVAKAGAVRDLTIPAIGSTALQGITYTDSVIQRRTGISGATASLDSTALEPQTATAEQLEHDASYARVELIARNMAKLGLKRLFAKILRIIVRNQDRPRTIRLRDKWVNFDPRAWNAAMDVTVNIGLGTGSRERDLAMTGAILKRQEQVISTLGPDNPIVPPSTYIATLHKAVEATGLANPEAYFKPVSDEEFAKWQASRPPKQDPRAEAEQGKLQLKTAESQARIATSREEGAAKLQNERERMEAEFAMRREELDREYELRREEMSLEANLKAGEIMAGIGGRDLTNIPRTH